ncbi:hypothetical protein ARALYDRAFT_343928 [Arabidopsis lyrata subsp. lyrata]|uniref:Pentatricopeptide repeat-containing protein n=1 Tax=Arabidopsis lyrata subsp. lyrata TaxID=81972 RepID=D7LG18_ARALL|nr:hypothetical protein ARALYDRAFT_343928 [Arabidopsis lyrata subsp. lyrata]
MYLSNELFFFGYAADIVGMEVVQRLHSEVLELGLGNNDRHAGMFFSSLRSPGYTAWRNLIWAYAAYDPMKAIAAFGKMEKTHIKPNLDSFRALMYAYAQAETKNEDALKVLVKMKEEYNLQPKIEHIGCYIDKLGKIGFIAEAIKVAAEIEWPLSNHICGMIFGECAKSLPVDKGSANKMCQVLTRTMLVHFFLWLISVQVSDRQTTRSPTISLPTTVMYSFLSNFPILFFRDQKWKHAS